MVVPEMSLWMREGSLGAPRVKDALWLKTFPIRLSHG